MLNASQYRYSRGVTRDTVILEGRLADRSRWTAEPDNPLAAAI